MWSSAAGHLLQGAMCIQRRSSAYITSGYLGYRIFQPCYVHSYLIDLSGYNQQPTSLARRIHGSGQLA